MGTIRSVLTIVFGGMMIFGQCLPFTIGGVPVTALGWAAAPGLIVIWLIPSALRARTRRAYLRHDGFLCPWCRYALTGLPQEGKCPECGHGYQEQACRVLYHCAYRAYQPDPLTLKEREATAWREAIEARQRWAPE